MCIKEHFLIIMMLWFSNNIKFNFSSIFHTIVTLSRVYPEPAEGKGRNKKSRRLDPARNTIISIICKK